MPGSRFEKQISLKAIMAIVTAGAGTLVFPWTSNRRADSVTRLCPETGVQMIVTIYLSSTGIHVLKLKKADGADFVSKQLIECDQELDLAACA